jgi:hypothetical protein
LGLLFAPAVIYTIVLVFVSIYNIISCCFGCVKYEKNKTSEIESDPVIVVVNPIPNEPSEDPQV